MADTILGEVGFWPRGEWNAETAYPFLSLVSYNGGSYVARQDVPAGTALTDTAYWMPISDTRETVRELIEQHPEWVTTVEDGSITAAKLAAELAAEIEKISPIETRLSNAETTVYTHTGDILTLDARMAVIEAGTTPEGSEITTARVGDDGITYDTLGAAIRQQLRKLKLDSKQGTDLTSNLVSKALGDVHSDWWVNTTSEVVNALPSGSNSEFRTLVLPCKPSTTYYVSKPVNGHRFAIAYCDAYPVIGTSLAGAIVSNNTATELSITTSETAAYLLVYYAYYTAAQIPSADFQALYDSIVITTGGYGATFEDSAARSRIDGVSGTVERLLSVTNLVDRSEESIPYGLYINTTESSIKRATTENLDKTRMLVIPCAPSTTYVVTKELSSRFMLASSSIYPEPGMTVVYVSDATATQLSITTGESAQWLMVYYWYSSDDSTEVHDSIVITKDTAGESAIDTAARRRVDAVRDEMDGLLIRDETTPIKIGLYGASIVAGMRVSDWGQAATKGDYIDLTSVGYASKNFYKYIGTLSWAQKFKAYMESAYPNVSVDNWSIPGTSAVSLSLILSRSAALENPPIDIDVDVAIIMLGNNGRSHDMAYNIRYFETVIRFFQSRGTAVYFCTPTAAFNPNEEFVINTYQIMQSTKIAAANCDCYSLDAFHWIEDYCDQQGVALAYDASAEKNFLTSDNLHPGDLGQEIIYKAVKSLLKV